MLLVDLSATALLDLVTLQGRVRIDRFEQLLHKRLSLPPTQHLKAKPCICLKALFSLSSPILYSDDFLQGEEP